MKSNIKLKQNVKIIVYNLDGSVKETIKLKNEYKTVGFNMFRDALKGAVTDLEIKYMAWGSSDTANAVGQTTLVTEFGRKQVTEQNDDGDGALITATYISPQEGNEYGIKELGWFAGAGATATPDSGILVSRVLYDHEKTNLESILIERTDGISEVV